MNEYIERLINRLHAIDPAPLGRDKAAIERAVRAHLEALGLPQRPFVWVENAQAGYQIIMGRVGKVAIGAAWAAVLDTA